MSVYFLDSSALVKRYVAETGSAWIRGLTDPSARNPLIIARIAWVEVLGALARRQREGNLTPDDVTQAIRAFRYDLNMQYQVSEMGPALAETAGDLVVRHPLRAYDAVQLASALRVQSDLARVEAPALMAADLGRALETGVQSDLARMEAPALIFLTADDRLLAIAQAEGLRTDNPNRHP